VTRRNRFKQAVSFWRAKQTQQWHRYSSQEIAGAPPYDFYGIETCYRELSAHEALWRDFFEVSGIKAVEVIYEDLDEKPFEYLEIKLAGTRLDPGWARSDRHVLLTRQSDDASEEYYRRYLRDLYRLGR
jgi:LPS sulfotransferase NodH